MLVWEGTSVDTNELSIISPSEDPAADIDITLPSSTGTLALLAGADTQVIFSDGGTAFAGDAGFVFNDTTDTLTLGEDGVDGKLILYNDGGTDYNLTLQPGTQSAAAVITFPGATGTLATLGNAETITGAKGFSSAPFSSVANTTALGTTSGEWADLYLGDGAVIYGQNDQSNTLTSSATGWTANLNLSADAFVPTTAANAAGEIGYASNAFSFYANSEDLTLTASSNTWTVGTGTGVTDISFGAINLVATGHVDAGTRLIETTTDINVTVDGSSGVYINNHASTINYTLPADPETAGGDSKIFIFRNRQANAITITPAAGDVIELDGADETAGETIVSTGAVGEMATLVGFDDGGTDRWIVFSTNGTWDGGTD
jgi:hypothetical protein